MKKFLAPLALYSLLAALYLAASGGPTRVQVLALSVLALGTLVPAVWAAHVARLKARTVVCGAFALVAMLVWDLTSHLVIGKVEPLGILREAPGAYAVGLIALACLSLLAAYLGAPPNNSSKPMPLRGTA